MKKLLILISIVAASMFATARAAEPTVLYERGGDGTAWSDADLADWVNDNSAVTQTIDSGLKISGTNQGWTSTKGGISYTANSIINLTATLKSGGAGGSNDDYTFLKLGDVEFRVHDNAYKAYAIIGEDKTELGSYSKRDDEYTITIVINQATNSVNMSISGSNFSGTAEGTIKESIPSSIALGHYKAKSYNWELAPVLKSIKITEEKQEVTMASYTLNYVCNGETIKNEEGSMAVGSEVSATSPLTVDGQKYYFADGATTSMTIQADSENVLNVEMREAYVYNYTVSNNVNDEVKTGTCVEGESIIVPYNRYILNEGTLYETNAINNEYRLHQTLEADFETTLTYKATDITDGIYFVEAEDITGIEVTTRSDVYVDVRCSNGAGGIAKDTPVEVVTLEAGKYKVTLGLFGNATQEYNVLAGDVIIFSASTNGGLKEFTSDEFPLTEPTKIFISGGWSNKPLDYILITGEVAKPVEKVTINDKDGNTIETLELTENETYQLLAVIEPENADVQTATWTSDNEEVASVVNGKVTARKVGVATITATAGEKSATCKITVKASEIIATSLTIDKTEAEVAVGGELKLNATVEPEGASVLWETSDAEIATVDENGKVTGVAVGEASITATAGSFSVTCAVTVNNPAKEISLNKTEVAIEVGDEVELSYTVDPKDTTDEATWSSSNEAIASVDKNGFVKALAVGEANITVTAGNQSATCKFTISAAEEGVLYKRTPDTWTSKDLEEWVLSNQEGNSGATQSIEEGLKMNGSNTGWYSTKEMTYTENSIVTLTATLHGGGATGRSGSYDFLKLGEAEVWMNGQDKAASIVIGDSTTNLTGYTRDVDFKISMIVDQARRDITVTVSGGASGEVKGKITNDLSNNVVVGHYKAGKEGYDVIETLKAIKISEELQDVTMADYVINYICNETTIKSEEGRVAVGGEVTAISPLTVDEQKYYFADGATTSMTIEFGKENILNVEMREAYVYNYSVSNNVNSDKITGSTVEGEEASVAYHRYILDGGKVYLKDPGSRSPYTETFIPDKDGYEKILEYSETEMTDGIYFVEGEDIEGMTKTSNGNAGARASNALGGYAAEAVTVYNLKPGKYIIEIANSGTGGNTMTVKAGEETVLTAETSGSWGKYSSEEFTIETNTDITFEGAADGYPLDYILITGKEGIDVKEISLDKTEATMTVGETLDLVATVTPSNATDATVTWTSDNTEVATVENGKVTALKRGQAKITAKAGGKEASCSVKVYPKLGDADLDGTVDINDAVDITNYVVGKKEVEADKLDEYKKAANANGDAEGRITFADASATVTLALTQEAPEAAAQSRIAAYEDESTDALVVGRASSSSFGTVVPVALDNTEEYVALQADIFLPEGMNVDVKAGSRAADTHTFMTNRFADNHIRVALFNFSGTAFADTDAPILEIVTDSFISASDVEINYIIASDADANKYMLASRSAEATAVAAIGLDANAPVKVFDMNGIFVSDSMVGLQQGIYIVRQGDQAKKVNIR